MDCLAASAPRRVLGHRGCCLPRMWPPSALWELLSLAGLRVGVRGPEHLCNHMSESEMKTVRLPFKPAKRLALVPEGLVGPPSSVLFGSAKDSWPVLPLAGSNKLETHMK